MATQNEEPRAGGAQRTSARTRVCALRRRTRAQDGGVLVLVAIFLPVALLLAAFVIDLGGWFQNQRHLQLQADAGVLAGADQFLKEPTSCPGQIMKWADNYAAPTAHVGGSDPVPKEPVGNTGSGKDTTATTTVKCPGQGSYVEVAMENRKPATFFSPVTPSKITAHARVNLYQVSEAGGSGVLPYAITESEAQSCCDKLVGIEVNNGTDPSHSLKCDGSTLSTDYEKESLLMESLQVEGCPTTQISAGSSTCATTAPPSCLVEFNGVAEGDYDKGLISRFENGACFKTSTSCTAEKLECKAAGPSKLPIATDYAYQLPALRPNDPRLITVFVVPNSKEEVEKEAEVKSGSLQMTKVASFTGLRVGMEIVGTGVPAGTVVEKLEEATKEITMSQAATASAKGKYKFVSMSYLPVVGYAAFYMAAWDHDPCIGAEAACPKSSADPAPPPGTKCDPKAPSGVGTAGAVWGYYVRRVTPGSSEVTGTKPCNPTENAATNFCIAQLTQ
jgi:hypothetical protein